MPFIASMGIYVVSKDVMLNLLRDQFPGANDFGSEVIPGATSIGLRVYFSFCEIVFTMNLCFKLDYLIHMFFSFLFLVLVGAGGKV